MLIQAIYLNPRGAVVIPRPPFAESAMERPFATPLSADVKCWEALGTAGTAGNLQGIGGAYGATAATGKARSTQQDLFHLMNRRDSRPWRPPH
jgi:transcription elongation factor